MFSIDWTLLKDILGSLSAIIVAIVAWRGFGTWRRELKGKAQFEAAIDILSLALQFEEDCRVTMTPENLVEYTLARNHSEQDVEPNALTVETRMIIQRLLQPTETFRRLYRASTKRRSCTRTL